MIVRKKAKMTQTELAKKLGITRGTIANWELGTSNPSVDMLLKLSEIFNVTTDYLLEKEK